MARRAWVLTREHNEYNQYGGYFVCVFEQKPTIQRLAEIMTTESHLPQNVMAAVAFLENLRNGGGRQGVEDEWYNLEEVEMA